jgi:hypothetical protein
MTKKKQETQKIESQELEQLQALVGKSNESKNAFASLCTNYTIALKKTNKDFEENYELFEIQLKETNEKQVGFVKELDEKYGQGKSYDLSTGEIKDVENNEKQD